MMISPDVYRNEIIDYELDELVKEICISEY